MEPYNQVPGIVYRDICAEYGYTVSLLNNMAIPRDRKIRKEPPLSGCSSGVSRSTRSQILVEILLDYMTDPFFNELVSRF